MVRFDPENVDPKFVSMVLYQAFDAGTGGVKDVYAEAWCLRDMELADYRKLEKYLIDNDLIEESGEPGYFKLTDAGREFAG